MRAQTPTILNVTMTNADEEYSLVIPAGTKTVQISTADGTAFRFAFVTGKVASPTAPYFTVPADTMYDSGEGVYFDEHTTIYLACDSAGKVAQILAWS